jgi:hypothetical protein
MIHLGSRASLYLRGIVAAGGIPDGRIEEELDVFAEYRGKDVFYSIRG